jgi:prepilin-type processing-associated H-X9-DG protein
VELLVVVAIIALLAAMLLPSLVQAKELAKQAYCRTNLRCLQLGNELYQQDFGGFYAPAAPFMVAYMYSSDWADLSQRNLHRWFGSRASPDQPFNLAKGPLVDYLPGKEVRNCPSFRADVAGFEAGCGGYGYNADTVGQYVIPDDPLYRPGPGKFDQSGNRADAFHSPSQTVAFADAAFVAGGLMEYSFVEPPRYCLWGTPARPSVHFRHLGAANVAWLDAHVSGEAMSFSGDGPAGLPYAGHCQDYQVGWFGPQNNELFDCE